MTPRILIIAGSDSGGGAGIQADSKTVTMLGGHAMTAITAITAQNTQGVQAVHPVPTDIVLAQIESVAGDIGVDAVKIGMIGSAKTARAVADRLKQLDLGVPVVFDPVMVASSGSALADADTIAAFESIMEIAMLLTPNLPELAALGGEDAMTGQTLIKGGHGDGDVIVDRLISPAGEFARWEDTRIAARHSHGTGCTLSSAIATGLGQGISLVDAIGRARQFVRLGLREAPGFGEGHGPMGQQAVRLDGLLDGPMLNQVTLPATDYEKSVIFWKNMGLQQIVDSPSNGYARFESTGGATLSIATSHAAAQGGGTAVYLECRDLDARHAVLLAQGIAFDAPPSDQSYGWREARLRDPAGNAVVLYRAGEMRRYPPWRISR